MGLGRIGLPLALRAAEIGLHVVGLDADYDLVQKLSRGLSHVEGISDTEVETVLRSGNLTVSEDREAGRGFEVAIVAVPAHFHDGYPDLAPIIDAIGTVGGLARRGSTVILESTVYPGATEGILREVLETQSGMKVGTEISFGFSPDRIDPGNTVWNLRSIPKVVSGCDAESLARVNAFYSKIVDQTVQVGEVRVAELSKLIENSFRYLNIAFVNELARLASVAEIDIWAAVEAAATKPFGFMRFDPGPGPGGQCLPTDSETLAWFSVRENGRKLGILDEAIVVNRSMPHYVVERLQDSLVNRGRVLAGSRILLLGFTYKRNVLDLRRCPAAILSEVLVKLGASVFGADPLLTQADWDRFPSVLRVDLDERSIASAGAVVLVVDHDAFDFDLVVAHSEFVLDCRHVLPVSDNVEFL